MTASCPRCGAIYDGRTAVCAICDPHAAVNYCWRSGECVLPGGHDGSCDWGQDAGRTTMPELITTTSPYDREVLVEVLIYHTRDGIKGCRCGWAEPGRSWPEHVATVYEESVRARV